MSEKVKLRRKHIEIIKTIMQKGKYKPVYSDQEPATVRLIRLGLIQWKDDYSGLVLTELGIKMKPEILNLQSY